MYKHKLFTIIMLLVLGVFLISCTSGVEFTVNFDSNGGTEVASIISDGSSVVSIPEDPTKEGYAFNGWYWDNESFERPFTASSLLEEPIQSNLTVYAKWTALSYNITYELNGGTNNQSNPTTFDINSSITLNDPTREGYTFGGWYSDAEFTTAAIFTTMQAEDTTVYAKWNINSYTLQFVDEDGTVLQTNDYEYQADLSSVTPPTATKEGYSFTDWDINLPLTMPADNVTLTAQYTINQYTITFDTNEGSLVTAITQDYATTVTSPDDPIKEGYTFGGWYSDAEFITAYSFEIIPAEDITVYAKWDFIVIFNFKDEQTEVFIEYNEIYNEQGATITLEFGTFNMEVSGDEVDPSILGTYEVVYSYTDTNDLEYFASRTVNVVDTTVPEISLIGGTEIVLEYGEAYVEFSAAVIDNYDEDLVVAIDNSALDLTTLGIYEITYNATDSSGNVAAEVIRTLIVVDTTPPEINLNGYNIRYLKLNEDYIEEGATATDNIDQDLIITIDASSIDVTQTGIYEVYYSTIDQSGNEKIVTRIVEVVDSFDVSLNGEELVVLLIGQYYDDELISVLNRNIGDYEIIVNGEIDFMLPGTYDIEYYAIDKSGDTSIILDRKIEIDELSVPVNEDNYIRSVSYSRFLYNVIELSGGDIIFGGKNSNDGTIYRTDKFGNLIWQYIITQDDYADVYIFDMIVDSEGNIVGVGTKYPIGYRTAFVIKLDSEGNLLDYFETIPVDGISYYKIEELITGKYYIASNSGYNQANIIKMDVDFNIIWNSDPITQELTPDEIVLMNNEIVLYGYARWGGNIRIVSFDLLGNIVNNEYLGVNTASKFKDLLIDGLDLIGIYEDYTNNIGKIAVFSQDNVDIYELTYNDYSVQPGGVIKLENGHYIISGWIYKDGETQSINDGILIELDENFSIIYTRVIGGTDIDQLTRIFILTSGSFVATGWTSSFDGDFPYNSQYESSIVIKSKTDFATYLLDTTAPTITINGDEIIYLKIGNEYNELGAVANDNVDDSVVVTVYGAPNTEIEGIYYVYYNAIDTSGNSSLARRTVVIRS